MGQLISGVKIAQSIYADIQSSIGRRHRTVHLRGVIVGHDPASIAYQNIKESACQKCGFDYSRTVFPADIDQETLVKDLHSMCQDPKITGVIVQLPLPNHLDQNDVLSSITPEKDVDAFSYILERQNPMQDIRPPAPKAMLKLFESTHQSIVDKKVVILGHGFLVGQPLSTMLADEGVQVQIVDSATVGAGDIIKTADVLFSGVGQPNLITPDMIKPGVIIIDAGYSRKNGVTCGDADPKCLKKASYMTPATGGVGPLTVAVLMQNAFELAHQPSTDVL